MKCKTISIWLIAVLAILPLCACASGKDPADNMDEETDFADAQVVYSIYWEQDIDDYEWIFGELNERAYYGDEALQEAARKISHGKPLGSVKMVSALAWALSPFLPEEEAGSNPQWEPDIVTMYANQVCLIEYLDRNAYSDVIDEQRKPGSPPLIWDAGLSVTVSLRDGHVVYVDGAWKRYTTAGDVVLSDAAPQAKRPKHLLNSSIQSPYTCAEGELEFRGAYKGFYDEIAKDGTRFEDAALQKAVNQIFAASPLNTVESGCEFAWQLCKALKKEGYLSRIWYPVRQMRYSDNVWYFVFCGPEPDQGHDAERYYVFVSGEDGQIIAMRRTLDWFDWERIEPKQ